MFAKVLAVFCALVAPGSSFVGTPVNAVRAAPRAMGSVVMESTYWEGKAPPSKVLGPVVSKIPGPALGVLSLLALGAGTYCVHESNIFHTLSVDNFNPLYIVGAQLTPISWGLHVASWIQKQNGK